MSTENPVIVAHRGLAMDAPENTLAAFAAALELGLGLEMDLRLTADRQVVILHDQRLERTTTGQGSVSEKPLSETKPLDAGSWFDASFSDQRVPTLEEMLDLVRARRRVATLLALDVKVEDQPIETEVCLLLEQYGLLEQTVGIGKLLTSSEFRCRFKAANPRFPAAIWVNTPDEWKTGLLDDSSDWLYIRFIPDEVQVADAHSAGKRVLAVGPVVMKHEPENWLLVRQIGIDAMVTDYPLECQRYWRNQNLSK